MRIGFIGVGVMGNGMVKNLLSHGYEVSAYTRTRAKALEALEAGAEWRESAADCVRDADAVITMVGFPPDVEEVYFAPGNILDRADPGTYLIDMTTTSPALAQRIFQQGRQRGLRVLDAPVTGGDIGARAGTLSILVGGEAADYQACRPLLAAMGTNLSHQGPAGCGQHAKLANQIMIAGTLSGLCEGLRYAQAKGLDGRKLLGALATGAAGSKQMDALGGKILAGDHAPGFFLKHFVKDMTLALGESRDSGLSLEVLGQVLENCRDLEERGLGDLGTQALMVHYRPEE